MKRIFKRFALVTLVLAAFFSFVGCQTTDTSVQADLIQRAGAAIIIDGSDSIDTNFQLPAASLGAAVTWTSSNTAIVAISETATDGFYTATVTRPQIADGGVNTSVTLTATITYEGVTSSVVKTVLVLAEAESTVYTDFALLHGSAALNAYVEAEGIVYTKFALGYFIVDANGKYCAVFTTAANTGLVNVGDRVSVKGTYSNYNTLYQIKDLTAQTIVSTGNAVNITKITLADPTDLLDVDSSNKLIHGQVYTITVTPQLRGSYNNVYLFDGSTQIATVYYNSLAASIDALEAVVGKLVTIDVVYYTYYSGGSVLTPGVNEVYITFGGGAADITEVVLTNNQKITADQGNLAITLDALSKGTATLPVTGAYGSAIAWEVVSGGATLAGAVVTYPEAIAANVSVVLRATLTLLTETAVTKDFTVVVTPISPNTVTEILTKITALGTASASITGTSELLQGTIIGFKNKSNSATGAVDFVQYEGVYISDGTNVVFVYVGGIAQDAYAIGDVVLLKATYKTYFYLPQMDSVTLMQKVTGATATPLTPVSLTIAQIYGYTNITTPYYNKPITVSGTLHVGADDTNTYLINAENQKLVFSRIVFDLTTLASMNGKEVTFTGFLNDYHSSGYWRITGDNSVFTVVALTGQAALDADVASLTLPTTKVEQTSIDLPAKGGYDSDISWAVTVGGDYASISGGKVTFADITENQSVTLRATVSRTGLTAVTKDFVISVTAITTSTIQAAKGLAANTIAQVEGTVFFVGKKGYYVFDATGALYIYPNDTPTVALGDKVVVQGTVAAYYNSIQFASPSVKSTVSTGQPYAQTASAYVPGTTTLVPGQTYTITATAFWGKVTAYGTYDNLYLMNGETVIGQVYYTSIDAAFNALKALSGKEVVFNAVFSATKDSVTPVLQYFLFQETTGITFSNAQIAKDEIAANEVLLNLSPIGGDVDTLPATAGTSSIVWALTATEYATLVGNEITYDVVDPSQVVTLTATYSHPVTGGDPIVTVKEYQVTISTLQAKVDADKTALTVAAQTELSTLTLPGVGANGSVITWTMDASTDASFVPETRVLTLNYKGAAYTVTLHATLSINTFSATKDFTVNVAAITVISDLSTLNTKTAGGEWTVPHATGVYLRGVVVMLNGDNGVFIQDASGDGMYCYGIPTATAGLVIGDEIIVFGNLIEYVSSKNIHTGLVRELEGAVLITELSAGNALVKTTITPSDVTAMLPTFWEYQGKYVSVTGLSVVSYSGDFVSLAWGTGETAQYVLQFRYKTNFAFWADLYPAESVLPEVSFLFYNIYDTFVYNILNVTSAPITDAQKVAFDLAALPANLELSANYTLGTPKYASYTTVVPAISDELSSNISFAGGVFTVTLPNDVDKVGTVTITVSSGEASDTKVINVTVKMLTEAQKLAAELAALPSTLSLSANYALPTLIYGSYTADPIISASLASNVTLSVDKLSLLITRPVIDSPDVVGTVTLTVTVGASTQTKEIAVTVLAVTGTPIIIYEVYGGGGNTGAIYKYDYVILYNTTGTAIDLSGYSIHYISKMGTFGTSNNLNLTGSIASHDYYVIKLAAGSGTQPDLPVTPDVTGSINMSGTEGKLALVHGPAAVAISGVSDVNVVDFIGFGGANEFETLACGILANSKSAKRNSFIDNNNNSTDFTVGTADLSYLLS